MCSLLSSLSSSSVWYDTVLEVLVLSIMEYSIAHFVVQIKNDCSIVG